LPGDLTTYVLSLVIMLSLTSLFWGLRWNNLNRIQKALLIFCLCCIAAITIKFALYGMRADRVGSQLYHEQTQSGHLTKDLQP
jgi:hypothetical protein